MPAISLSLSLSPRNFVLTSDGGKVMREHNLNCIVHRLSRLLLSYFVEHGSIPSFYPQLLV